MTEMDRRSILVSMGAMGAALASPVILRAQTQVVLKLHHFLPAMAPLQRAFLEPWAQEVSDASEGAIKIEIYPAMSLGGNPAQLIDQVRKGIADLAWTIPVYTPGRFPIAETMALPFMVTDAERTSVAMSQLMQEFGADEYLDYKPLAFHVHASGKFHTRDVGVRSREQLQGMRMRAPNRLAGDLLGQLGAEPVFFPVTDTVVGLSNGVIDGVMLPYEVVPAFKLQDLTSYSSEVAPGARGLYTQPFAFVMNKDVYDEMPDDLKTVIDNNSGLQLSRRLGNNFDRFEAIGRGVVEKTGNEILEIPADEAAEWREAAQPIYEEWASQLDEAGFDGQEVINRLNELLDAG